MIYEPLPVREKPPYLLGLLCFIPLVGALVGIVLLLLGILKYKDKLLSGIGIFGILFTILIYGGLFYWSQNSNTGKKQWATLSQMQMDGLVKDIEFYKIQNNRYPDSLQALSTDSNFVNIYDPVLGLTETNIIFNYEKAGDHYKLFSSGLDGIKNTADDFYPTIEIKDSSRIGLRR